MLLVRVVSAWGLDDCCRECGRLCATGNNRQLLRTNGNCLSVPAIHNPAANDAYTHNTRALVHYCADQFNNWANDYYNRRACQLLNRDTATVI